MPSNKVSQDAMNLSVMNQKVQRKMGGGGAKSKNAPKFTEAITQGLGPMLYGAARGTAAGLAGIGGDIEELARLGINYAGDKLQGRFPNMLDKRDVVSPKATLPTSERVLSKIPSLKDFGAGPEARHSEDIAAKLGMYGLSNIAAPKAGKAVVQGVNATGKALAPKAGEMLENYMVRTGGILPMDVWHGSPHRFPPTAKNPLGEFDASKIGTGEGAQAYGYGHYVAEQPLVAKDYKFMERNWFDTDVATYQGKPIQYWYDKAMRDKNLAHRTKNPKLEKDANARLAYWENVMLHEHPESVLTKMTDKDFGWPEATNYAKSVKLDKFQGIAEPGSLYKVDLPDEQIAKMLDWDKPLNEQTPYVQKIINEETKRMGGSASTGERAYKELMFDARMQGNKSASSAMRSNEEAIAASNRLRELGIPGIRYLDQGSRDAGEGTRNFVVFPGNEEMLNILSREKDGGLVHGKKNGGEAKKPFSNDFERRQQMAGSVMPSQREMEEALRPATLNSLLKRAADRRQGKAMQEEPESPETQPEAEVRPYEPVFRQNKSANIQQGLESLGFPKPRARSIAQNIMGEGGTGVLDFEPISSTLMSLQETKRAVERARDKGDQTGVVTGLGLGALNAAAGLWGIKALAKTLASSIKKSPYQRYSPAEFDRILRESAAQESQRLLPTGQRLLNGPTEQLLLNAPKREKTVFEMQQELAQKHAMLPKSQYGLELPPGNTAAQRLEAMGFTEPGYHGSTKAGFTKFDDKNPAFFSDRYDVAASHAGSYDEAVIGDKSHQGVYEVLLNLKNPMRKDWEGKLWANGPEGMRIDDWANRSRKEGRPFVAENISDVGPITPGYVDDRGVGTVYVMHDPDRIRSPFAAGDPRRRNAAVAAATGMAAPDLLAEEYANGGQVTSDDLILIERRR